jgi:small subunit ribosomal protein S8
MNKINIGKDLLVSIKNGYSNKNKYAYCKISKFCINILEILYREGLICGYSVEYKFYRIQITLKYFKDKPLLSNINFIGKPSLENSFKAKELKKFVKKYNYFILSTSNYGILSSNCLEKQNKIGGKLLFKLTFNI